MIDARFDLTNLTNPTNLSPLAERILIRGEAEVIRPHERRVLLPPATS